MGAEVKTPGRPAPPEEMPFRECALCGYTAAGRFEGDICPHCGLTFWRCGACGYTFTAPRPPEECPSCHQKSEFINITCYTPECGGPGHIDPRL